MFAGLTDFGRLRGSSCTIGGIEQTTLGVVRRTPQLRDMKELALNRVSFLDLITSVPGDLIPYVWRDQHASTGLYARCRLGRLDRRGARSLRHRCRLQRRERQDHAHLSVRADATATRL